MIPFSKVNVAVRNRCRDAASRAKLVEMHGLLLVIAHSAWTRSGSFGAIRKIVRVLSYSRITLCCLLSCVLRFTYRQARLDAAPRRRVDEDDSSTIQDWTRKV